MFINLKGGDPLQYGRSIQKMDHNIQDTGLFTDSHLIRAIDAHPDKDLDIFTQGALNTCVRGNTSSSDLLEAVKRGALSLKLRHMDAASTPHGRLVQHLHRAFSQHMRTKTKDRSGALLISSPRAQTAYGAAVADTALWHLRGRQRIYVYPNHAPFIKPADIQSMVSGGAFERLSYSPSFDRKAIAIDLEPGELICWPHMAPLRVDNLESLNVSLSLESLSFASRCRIGAHFMDGYLNQKFGTSFSSEDPHLVPAALKAGGAALLKRAQRTHQQVHTLRPSFRINLSAPNCVEPI